jgi:hypothetical protein
MLLLPGFAVAGRRGSDQHTESSSGAARALYGHGDRSQGTSERRVWMRVDLGIPASFDDSIVFLGTIQTDSPVEPPLIINRRNPIQKIHLRRKDFRPRGFESEPPCAIHFRERLATPAPGRPFDIERIAHQVERIEVALSGERYDALPAPLAYLAEGPQHADRGPGTKLFPELPPRGPRLCSAKMGRPDGQGALRAHMYHRDKPRCRR